MKIDSYTTWLKMEKSTTPSLEDIKNGALVSYKNGIMETIDGHIRFFISRPDGSMEWTAGSSDDVTDLVDFWFKKY